MDSPNSLVYGDVSAEIAPASAHECAACGKRFTTKGNLDRHLEAARVCRMWLAWSADPNPADLVGGDRQPADATNAIRATLPPPVRVRAVPVMTGSMIADLLAVTDTTCEFCGKEFSTPGSLTRHYRTSVACDRTRARALMSALREAASDFDLLAGTTPFQSLQDPMADDPTADDAFIRATDTATQIIPGPALLRLPAPVKVRA